ncbi:MAG: dienelactone hydrolase family protein [Coxiellaceae bacterium]|nr:dienelactone hydrolase family protein [Coxiellaceae bacterium]
MFSQDLEYHDGDTRCIGHLAYDDSHDKARPCVLVVHAFEGRNQLACDYANKLAELGYVGIAVDMYGEGNVAHDLEGCMEYMMPLFQDRAALRARILAAFETAKGLDVVDSSNIGAMGFCFGGMTCLDLARSGADIKGVVSIHGVFAAPEGLDCDIKAKVLALHGYQDPQVPPDQLAGFADEMTAQDVDWQVLFFGNAKHAFTDPDAAKIGAPEMGREYSATATARSWQYCQDFFSECFG